MRNTLSIWHADHVNFGRLLNLLDGELKRMHDADSPDYERMLDVMYYMTHYPDVLHHPKEDLVFARLKERDAKAGGKVDELSAQHEQLRTLGQTLVSSLEDVLSGSIVPMERIESAARSYVNGFRRHMHTEEADVLPLAARLLDEADWARIDAEIHHFEDPLFGTNVMDRYAALRDHLGVESPSPASVR